jgi:hypothetical protein
MQMTRFSIVMAACCVLPFSLTGQSVDVRIPQPPMHVVPFPMELHLAPAVSWDRHDSDRDLPVEEHETIQKSFSMAAVPHRSLEVDNVWGSIEVVGANSDRVQLTVNKSIRAESKDKLGQARKEVTLDISEQEGLLKFYVNGPFRCNCDDGCGHREFDGYIVKMDFQLQVPHDLDIKLKTVNEGHVVVRDINGSFLVRNVNGDFKTFNGSIYSDFPVTALPARTIQEEHHGAKVLFRADRYTGVRIGSGGPEIKVENLNGDIRILENHE